MTLNCDFTPGEGLVFRTRVHPEVVTSGGGRFDQAGGQDGLGDLRNLPHSLNLSPSLRTKLKVVKIKLGFKFSPNETAKIVS